MTSPGVAARMAATFDRFSDGRLLINLVTGGDPEEAKGAGVFLSHDERYEVTDEFLNVWKRVMAGETVTFAAGTLTWKARKLSTCRCRSRIRCCISAVLRRLPLIWRRGRLTFISLGEPPAQVAEKIAEVRKKADSAGRAMRFGIRLHVTVRETNDRVWQAANALIRLDKSACRR